MYNDRAFLLRSVFGILYPQAGLFSHFAFRMAKTFGHSECNRVMQSYSGSQKHYQMHRTKKNIVFFLVCKGIGNMDILH